VTNCEKPTPCGLRPSGFKQVEQRIDLALSALLNRCDDRRLTADLAQAQQRGEEMERFSLSSCCVFMLTNFRN